MPEGDTIHRTAETLRRALVDKEVRRYWAYRPELLQPNRAGHRVVSVEALGKNLLIRFDDERVLYSHMKMTGSWHVYRPGERWRKAEHLARVVIENRDYVAVCFSAPDIELLTSAGAARHAVLASTGPDLLAEEFDEELAVTRLLEAAGTPLGVAVLDQRVVAGIGNVYKSEMLFLNRLDPFIPVEEVAAERLRRFLRETRVMMRRNLRTAARTTRARPGSPVWVYERTGQPCLRCGQTVRMERQGDLGRSTYYCATCQGVGDLRAAGRDCFDFRSGLL